MTHAQTRTYAIGELRALYEEGEAESIVRWLFDFLRIDPLNTESLEPEVINSVRNAVDRLRTGEPLQYILNEAWFCDLKLFVDHRVLIPRPETEELVEWVATEYRSASESLHILDIGTGSGCIPLALKKKVGGEVHALDASIDALEVAAFNAGRLRLPLQFHHLDILEPRILEPLPTFDVIISNPPYIPESDAPAMHKNVLEHEPHMALFVPENDPLLFYRAIAIAGKEKLRAGGKLFFEIHESAGVEVTALLHELGYHTECRKDMQGKDRMVMAGIA